LTDGWKRNSEGLRLDDFQFMNIKGNQFCLLKDTDGIFASTVRQAARQYNLLMPSLGDVVDYINVGKGANANLLNLYLQSNQVITTTVIKANEENNFVEVRELDRDIREAKDVPVPTFRRRMITFNTFNKWLDLNDLASLVQEEYGAKTNLAEAVFNRGYVSIMSALNALDSAAPKKLFVPRYSMENDSLSIAKYNGEIIIVKHNICSGTFCTP
jgi:hypothetical protein